MIKRQYRLLALLLTLSAAALSAQHKDSVKHYNDGPYIFRLADNKVRVITTDTTGMVIDVIKDASATFHVVSHSGRHSFDVALHNVKRPEWKHKKTAKTFVMSDPHGNLDCFVSVLYGNNVINKNYEWAFGKNHLVIIGDVFDRGKDVLPIFWLIYKLEQEAREAGGKVSFLIGNHETMVLAGDLRYTDKMYPKLAEKLGMTYPAMFGSDTELGRWLMTRNTIETIGTDLFVHAGLGEDFLSRNLDIALVNETISEGMPLTKEGRNELSETAKFMFGTVGPVWYRGMVRNEDKYFPLHISILDRILQRYGVKRIIVGHTIFPDVRTFYGGKVIGVNVDNKDNFENVRSRALLIDGKHTYIVDDKGIM